MNCTFQVTNEAMTRKWFMLGSRLRYYLKSIYTLFFGVKNRSTLLAVMLRLPIKRPAVLHLENGLVFRVRTAMDVWIIKETWLSRL